MDMQPHEILLAVHGIRTCKAKYWHFMDKKRWDDLKEVFTKDAFADFRGERDITNGEPMSSLPPIEEAIAQGDPATFQGRDLIVENLYSGLLQEWTTFHLGGEPIIEVTGPETGTGIWPLFDYISHEGRSLKGYGHYEDRYRFEDGAWRMEYISLTRIRSDGEHPLGDAFG